MIEQSVNRRRFLRDFGMGMGSVGLAPLLAQASEGPLAVRDPHFPAKAKHVIHIFCSGGPSHVDTFDPKPALKKWAGKEVPEIGGTPLPCEYQFTPRGQSGIEVSELFPNLGKHVDKMAFLRAVHTDTPEHKAAQRMMHTGSAQLIRPSLGSWLLYGLGTVNQNLPGFVAIGNGGFGGPSCWNSSFLPSVYQGTQIRTIRERVEDMVQNISNDEQDKISQRRMLDFAQQLNARDAARFGSESELEARIHSFELAFNMQTEAAEVFDLSKESTATIETYGKNKLGPALLSARRMVEAGVRIVQVWHGSWDHHDNIYGELPVRAGEADVSIAALLNDLEERGLLDETLVVWGGEFGRTPGYDKLGNGKPGRDHHNSAFTTWMAGAGIKGGTVHGASDEFGMHGVEGRVHVHDLHATILHLLGFDHEKLTYRYSGREFRLTDVYGEVVKEVLA